MNKQEILRQCKLDFSISKRPLVDINNNPSGYFGLYNDSLNKCIHTVKKSYQVTNNEEIVDLVLSGIGEYGSTLKVVNGGAINDGRKIYLQLAIEGDTLLNGDRIKRYITILDSNDGTSAFSVGIGDETMSCENQFYMFYKKGEAKFRHNSLMKQKMIELPKLIDLSLEQSLKQSEVYKVISEVDVEQDDIDRLVKALLGYDRVFTSVADLSEKSTRSINIMDTLYDEIETEINDKGLNAWGLHSGVTRFTTHSKSAPKRENGRFESLALGSGYKMNHISMNYAKRKSGILVLENELELV